MERSKILSKYFLITQNSHYNYLDRIDEISCKSRKTINSYSNTGQTQLTINQGCSRQSLTVPRSLNRNGRHMVTLDTR